jgi:FkbM family methyltransferase
MPSLRQSLVAKLLRHYPLYSGAGTLANSQLVTRIAGTSHESAWCPTAGGEVLAPLHDYIGRAAYYCGDLDPKVTWICRRLVMPGDTAVDIGANIGLVTMLLSRLVGDAGNVFAFEPNPPSFKALSAAVARNRATNVELQRCALGSQSEERDLSIPTENAGAASLSPAASTNRGSTTRVSVRTLDEFVAERGISRIQFMKIDVEGFESEVLRGGKRALESIHPEAILFEMNERFTEPMIKHPVFDILAGLEYSFFSLPKAIWRIRAHAFDPRHTTKIPGHDVIAIAAGERLKSAAARLRQDSTITLPFPE